MKSWQAEGLSADEKYDIEEYADMMKAFTNAATEGDLEQVKYGLSIGAEINALGERWTGWTGLHHAADVGHLEIVQYLVEQGADKDRITLDYSNYTALHLAVSKRHYHVVDYLLSVGVDTEMFTATGCCGTALHLATSLADPILCSSLLNAGADPGVVSEEGSSILHYLAVSQVPEASEILKMLLDKHKNKVDINAVDWDGYSPIMRAASIGDATQVEIYLQSGADTQIKETNFGKDVFKIAEELAQTEVVKLLKSS